MAIFGVVLILDELILPALFGFRESLLSLIVLILPVLYIGPTGRLVSFGVLFSFLLESLRGLEIGALALPFLVTVVIVYLVQRFLDIKYTHNTRFGLGKSVFLALTSIMLIFIFSIFYKHGSINISYLDPILGLIAAVETLLLIFVFNIVFNKKSDYL